MSNFLRTITSSSGKPIFTVVTLASLVLISLADLIVPHNKIGASGIAQDRVYEVREGTALDKVIKIDIYNINSPEFPKGFQVKIKNISRKPIYHILINVHLPETEPFRLKGNIMFQLRFGHPKLVQNSLRLEDITESEREEHPLTLIEPGKSALIGLDDKTAEYVRKVIETEFPGDNPATKKLELTFQVINFGDGTGYIIGRPFPRNRQIGLGSPKEPKIPVPNAPISPKGITASSPKPTFSFFSFLFSFLPKSGSSFFLPKPEPAPVSLPRLQAGCDNLELQSAICVNTTNCLVEIPNQRIDGMWSIAIGRTATTPGCENLSCGTNDLIPCPGQSPYNVKKSRVLHSGF